MLKENRVALGSPISGSFFTTTFSSYSSINFVFAYSITMTDYLICIPSYKRNTICNQRTLATLFRHNIDPSKIYVYVADQDEYQSYSSVLDKTRYNELRIGVKGLVAQRQHIAKEWGENKHLLFLDDDIEDVDLSLTTHATLDAFIRYAFEKCIELKSFIWGVNPVFNLFFRKGENRQVMTTYLNIIVGAFYGVINRPECEQLNLTLTSENDAKEDVERSIKYFIKDGIVLRFNKVAIKTKYYGADGGGLGKFKDRIKPMADACSVLQQNYNSYGKIKTRKNGMTEFILKRLIARAIDKVPLPVVYEKMDVSLFAELEQLFSKIKLPFSSGQNNRLGFPKRRGMVLGVVRARMTGVVGLSYNSKKYPKIYEAVMKLGQSISPHFEFKTIQVNHNLVCPKHYDSNNVGESILISFGDYQGCNIVVNGVVYDAKYTPVRFNGALLEHWNTDDLIGNKYSLVFF